MNISKKQLVTISIIAVLIGLLLPTLALAKAKVSTGVIYADRFTGSSTKPLNGTTPATDTTGAKWSAPTLPSNGGWAADGSTVNSSKNYHQQAYLSFKPTSGNIYTLSATLDPTGKDGNWLGLGFSSTNSKPLYNNGGGPWMVLTDKGSIQLFAGPGTSGPSGGNTITLGKTAEVVLNTKGPKWTVQWFYNGKSVGSHTYSGTGADVNPTGITAVGIQTNLEPGKVGSFLLKSSGKRKF